MRSFCGYLRLLLRTPHEVVTFELARPKIAAMTAAITTTSRGKQTAAASSKIWDLYRSVTTNAPITVAVTDHNSVLISGGPCMIWDEESRLVRAGHGRLPQFEVRTWEGQRPRKRRNKNLMIQRGSIVNEVVKDVVRLPSLMWSSSSSSPS